MAKLDGTNGLIQQYDYQVLTTAFSYTFAAGTQTLIINPAGTLATGTITMPAAPADGMVIWITTTKQIVALTINGNTGQTLTSGVTSLAPNQAVAYLYRSSNTTWYPFETQMAQGNGPAFSAYLASNQSIPNNTITKITINTEIFDTASAFDSATNYRFTPLVAGYYQIIGAVADVSGGTTGGLRAHLYKNGAAYTYSNIPMTNTGVICQCSAIISFNGSTDYVELYGSQNSGGALNIGGGATVGTMLSGCLLRTA